MSSSSSTSSANHYPSPQQPKLQQVSAAVGKDDETARSLRLLADEAQRIADREQAHADSLAVQSDEAQATASQARSRLAVVGATGSIIAGRR
jgi:hypothetical protein